jgi:divalent anion:Na+ symporter, DASS family
MPQRLAQLISLSVGLGIWFSPVPAELSTEAWQLFAIFFATIFSVIIGGFSILLASILALVVAVLTGTLQADIAYGGFSEGFILLIVVAFLIGRGVVNSGLGHRIGYLLVRLFGRSSLGLSYAMIATDALIAPAFPSNTARSGVLYPIVYSLAETNGSMPWEDSRFELGAFLMMTSMVGLGLSSGLWLTAMAANPVGVAMLAERGLEITFLSWFLASSLPTISCMLLVPWVLYKIFPPRQKSTPEAPRRAAQKLAELGPMSTHERVTLATFVGMVLGWGLAGLLGFDATAIAFLGLAVLMLGGVFTLDDLKSSGDALETLLWFGILYTLSTQLNQLGFMQYAGDLLGGLVAGYSWPVTYVLLVLVYVLIHYLFVSQSAHLLALFSVFVGLSQPDVPLALIGMMLLFATNFFSVLTPQGSSCNVLFIGSGYITGSEVYRYGGLITFVCLAVYLIIGTPWILWVLG